MAGWEDSTPVGDAGGGGWDASTPAYQPRPELINSIIYNESRGNPKAVSPKNARGLMQVEPETAKDYGVTNPDDLKDPNINRRVGTAYFTDLLNRYGGDERKALIAYNQGPNREGLAPGAAEYADAVLSRATPTPTPTAAAPAPPPAQAAPPTADPNSPSLWKRALGGAKAAGGLIEKSLGGGVGPMGLGTDIPGAVEASEAGPSATGRDVESGVSMGGMMAGAYAGEKVAGWPGAVAGVALANPMTDRVNDYIDNYLYGTPVPPISDPSQLTIPLTDAQPFNFPGGRMAQSATIGAGVEALSRGIPAAGARMFGFKNAAEVGQEAAAKQELENSQHMKTLSESSATGLEQVRKKVWDKEEAAQQQAYAATQKEMREINAGKATEAERKQQEANLLAEQKHVHEQEQARAALLNRSREQTAAAIAPEPKMTAEGVAEASPEEIERKKSFVGAVFDEHEAMDRNYGGQYEAFEKEHGNKIVGNQTPVMVKGINSVEAEFPTEGTDAMSPTLLGLVKRARKVAGMAGEAKVAAAVDFGARDVEGKPVVERIGAGQPEGQLGSTVNEYRTLRRDAYDVAQKVSSDKEVNAANQIAEMANRAMEKAEGLGPEDIKTLRNLNDKYRDLKQHFNHRFMTAIGSTTEPSNAYKIMFQDDNARALRLLAQANPLQREIYRDMAGDFYNRENMSLKEIYDSTDHAVLKNLYGDRFTEALPHMEANFQKGVAQLASHPAQFQEWGQNYNKNLARIHDSQVADMRDELGKMVQQMDGPLGKQLKLEFHNALGYDALQQVAKKVVDMSKEDFLKEYAATLKSPQLAARDAIIAATPSKTIEALKRFVRFRGMFYSAVLTGSMLGGHVSPTIAGLAGITAMMSVPVGAAMMGRAMLKDEAMAGMVADIATDPAKLDWVKRSSRRAADLAAAAATRKAKEQARQMEQKDDAAINGEGW